MAPERQTLLDTKQAAGYLDLSPNTLDRWRYEGKGPHFVKLGRAVRYRVQDLDAFLEAGTVAPGVEA
jgi:excisionase family DNA binding protein